MINGKKSLNIMEKMMDPNIIDYYIINCAIPSIITIENHYQIDFGKPVIDVSRMPMRPCLQYMKNYSSIRALLIRILVVGW